MENEKTPGNQNDRQDQPPEPATAGQFVANADQQKKTAEIDGKAQEDIAPTPQKHHWTAPIILQLVFDFIIMAATFTYATYAIKQWGVMTGQLAQMQAAGTQTDQMLCLIRQQLEQTTKQAAETHDLAVSAGKQADFAKVQSANTVKLADAARKQASAAADQVRQLQAGVDETHKLATAAANGNAIAQQAMEIQSRPWIDAPETIPSETFVAGPTDGNFSLTLPLRNFGNSPAIVMTPRFVLATLSKPRILFWKSDLKTDVCGGAETRFKLPIFPHDKKDKTVQVGRVEALITEGPPRQLSGCIVYYGTMGGGPYTTKVVYNVTYTSDQRTITSIALSDSEIQ